MDQTGAVVPYGSSYTGQSVAASESRLVTGPEGRLVTGQVVSASPPAGDEPDPGYVLRIIIAASIAIAYLAVGMVSALALFGSMVIVAIIIDWLSDIQLINMVASRTLPPSQASLEQSVSPVECTYFNRSLTNSALSGRSLFSGSDEIIVSGWQVNSAPPLGNTLFFREALFQGKSTPQLFVSTHGFCYLSSTSEVHHWYAHEPTQIREKNVWTEARLQLKEHPAFLGVLKNLKTCSAPAVLISNLLRCGEISFSHQRSCFRAFTEPTPSNFFILQTPALPKSSAMYTFPVLFSLAVTAYTAFRTIKQEALQQGERAAVHVGNWGCAEGHNPLVIALIQLAMAQSAEIDEIHYYPQQSMKELTAAGQYLAWISSLDSNSPELAEIVGYNREAVSREGPNSITMYGFLQLLEVYALRWNLYFSF